ncbi:hypothetical protein Cyast_1593 [Cyanobacterium stanieri PCC 7202]|uniref:Uncharacterized protein n=1 Tax=Cyanobacterium stanieri (strain ATCC 29140 / PCC 7202) TaxID=292563 RepID=K9YL00_CYASC|nr:hypothetical protein Cyast_1593 [Cyanobacterium stanieri PCC 7202]
MLIGKIYHLNHGWLWVKQHKGCLNLSLTDIYRYRENKLRNIVKMNWS